MAFNKQVDYIPNQAYSGHNTAGLEAQYSQFEKRKWRVFIFTFLLVLIVANGVIWSLPKIYQSQSTLHFSYASQTDQAYSEIAQRQITMHQKRLKSINVLTKVVNELAQQQRLYTSVEELTEQFSVDVSLTGRMITLTAAGPDPSVLKPYLDSWIKVYLAVVDKENTSNNSQLSSQSEQQLAMLEEKIAEQKVLLQAFASEHQITSLERDENRILSQTKNLANNLDQALADEAQAQALLDSIIEANASGQVITNPADKAQIDNIKSRLSEINANLTGLQQKYTQAYLDLNPDIVAQQNKAKNLKLQLQELLKASQQQYLLEVRRNLSAASGKVAQLTEQMLIQDKNAQIFSQNLAQYKNLDDHLKALQSQVQSIKNQQVAQDVAKPFEANISILEPAYFPEYATGPNYLSLLLYSVIAALGCAIFTLLLFNFIFKPKGAAAANHFVVIPNQAHLVSNPQTQGLASAAPELLAETQALPVSQQVIRLLSEQECQALYAVANNQGKALIGLLLSGVSEQEVAHLTKQQFSQNNQQLQVQGQFARDINLSESLAKAIQALSSDLTEQQIIWPQTKDPQYFQQLLINAGHDAQLDYPEQLNLDVIRHTYLTFLVKQGCKLNDLELLAGFTSADELARYRQINQQGQAQTNRSIQSQYPYI